MMKWGRWLYRNLQKLGVKSHYHGLMLRNTDCFQILLKHLSFFFFFSFAVPLEPVLWPSTTRLNKQWWVFCSLENVEQCIFVGIINCNGSLKYGWNPQGLYGTPYCGSSMSHSLIFYLRSYFTVQMWQMVCINLNLWQQNNKRSYVVKTMAPVIVVCWSFNNGVI